MTSFTDHYTYSADVVLAGRAAAYLDIHTGTISATENVGQEIHISASIPIDGPPILSVAPLAEYRGERSARALARLHVPGVEPESGHDAGQYLLDDTSAEKT